MTPQEGTIWKAAGLRLAYVAQHAFHHLEKHMDKTPTQYIMWRFAGNDDQESLEFKSDKLSVDEAEAVVPQAIFNRRQKKKEKTFEYEVNWMYKPPESNVWVEKEILVKMGYLKMVQREDEKQT